MSEGVGTHLKALDRARGTAFNYINKVEKLVPNSKFVQQIGRVRNGIGTRLPCIALAVTLGFCALATTASADTATITFTDANGSPDPVARASRTVTISGTTSAPEHLYIKSRAAGDAPCASRSADDPGHEPFELHYTGDSFAAVVNGDFTLRRTGSWSSVGPQLFCIWLASSWSQSVTPISQIVTFRAPTGTIAVAVTPTHVAPGQAITVTISGTSEAPGMVSATLHDGANLSCAASYREDGGRTLVRSSVGEGAFSLVATTKDLYANDTAVCAWLGDSDDASPPAAGPQAAFFSMVALLQPGCVVPVIPGGTPRVRVVAALEAGRCALGRETLVPSRSQPRGTLIRLGADADMAVAPPGLVDAVFSAGAPCRVPALKPRMRLATAKARLRAAGCTVGRVRAVRSARRVGMVIAYGTKPGTRLAPRAKVAIVVSRGPGRRRG
jgi:hypothetical protein